MRETILVVEDQAGMRSFLVTALDAAGFEVEEAGDGKAALAALNKSDFDLVLTDLKMPEVGGMEVLDHVRRESPDTVVIVLTAFGTIEVAVQAMRQGAADFLTKPIESPEVLVLSVERALRERRLRQDNERLRRDGDISPGFDGIVQADPRTKEAVRLANAVAGTRSTVLLTGESGTGKDVFARAIHKAGPAPDSPFVAVNCAALPSDLLESEFFGHEKGAFTGASSRRLGRFELARDGTLFLDEVAELAPPLQAKLLRVLQEGTFERVGGSNTLTSGARIVAATNRDLAHMTESGRFRSDLYYRLSVFPIELPALRDRPADIIPLALNILARLAARSGAAPLRLSDSAAKLLKAYRWPGNVRELANVLERATILARDDDLVPELLPQEVRDGKASEEPDPAAPDLAEIGSLRDLERQAVVAALAAEDGNRRRAARRLGISLRTLQYRLKQWGMTRLGE